ncbi:23S rRNA (cytidine1920-2'-O)/16S rRNA (cytidine1409-2'-O)-methyltransferase [Desulfofundulus australicus DSM 11792]|uniref:23S rRNA (Cytidine1920-2'-O)/16S rRNA (Cytidine1409-2'-O)-methyltransferase n=1 Tax=Desulfofundulus australicus DSM 11792 TaxID=1121425 RepID=A0A1M5AGG2_9FIRM|nr:TlyA family RNA methyltransferase [Desulfofundulus australicus]SHF29234.1 23S rRNA (cytidine1920-2'-O)/16S rRNA (cytidine1409-2'-O)-methyltransferase [Desulfofundulus australicus DSM 11792]
MTIARQRLDMLLVERGLFPSREKARAAIMAGQVRVDGQTVDKPGRMVNPASWIEVTGRMPYVSRGGLKLEKAIHSFQLDFTGRVVLDVGASHGGFTDCALQHGARLVIAVDVGYGQMAWKLRNDPRVVLFERTNIRHLKKSDLPCLADIAVVDVSFISLEKVLPVLQELTTGSALGVALIKPQFEAGREKVGKKGVVRDPGVHQEVISAVCRVINNLGWGVRGLDYSPIKGPEGNIEFLVCFDKNGPDRVDIPLTIPLVVARAHAELNGGS